MKVNKVALGLLVILGVVLVPRISLSGSDKEKSDVIVLSANNTMSLNSEVDGESTSEIIAKARELSAKLGTAKDANGKKKPLILFLNTPGGSIQSGLELIEALNGLGRPVNTVTLFAASMGFQIAQNLDERLILKNGILMSHHAAGEIEGSFGGTQPSQMDSRYQLWLDRVRELDEQTVKRTNGKQTYESYTKQYDHEMWLGGTKSVAQGYADKVVQVRCDETLNGTTKHHVNFMGMDIQYELDKCPINTSPMNVTVVGGDSTFKVPNEVINEVKAKFLKQYTNQQNRVIDMY